jgi:MbtH protein
MNDDHMLYAVVANREDLYAVWPVTGPRLPGWRTVGRIGTKNDCLDYIREMDAERRVTVLKARLEQGRTLP